MEVEDEGVMFVVVIQQVGRQEVRVLREEVWSWMRRSGEDEKDVRMFQDM